MAEYVDLKHLVSLVVKELKSLKGNDRLDISNISNIEPLLIAANKKIDMNDMRWHGGGGSVAGSNTQVQFNDNGAFGADSDFTWDKDENTLSFANSPTIQTIDDSVFQFLTGDGQTTDANGGDWNVNTGNGNGAGNGGDANVTLGGGGMTGNGGTYEIESGLGGSVSGDAGDIKLTMNGATSGRTGNTYVNNAGGDFTATRDGGFLFIPIVNDVPTGTPSGVNNSIALTYDTLHNDLYFYNSGWKKVHLS